MALFPTIFKIYTSACTEFMKFFLGVRQNVSESQYAKKIKIIFIYVYIF